MTRFNVTRPIISESPAQEIKSAVRRIENDKYSNTGSLKGRAICLLVILPHLANIVIRPVVYLICAVVGVVFAAYKLVARKKGSGEELEKAVCRGACVITSPFGQAFLVGKAGLGVLLPQAYFKKSGGSGVSEAETGSLADADIKGFVCSADFPNAQPETALSVGVFSLQQGLKDFVAYEEIPDGNPAGVRRDFIYRVFQELSTKHGLMNGRPPSVAPKVAEDIGAFLGDGLNRLCSEEVNPNPIGEALHPSFFKCLTAFTKSELSEELEEPLSPARIFDIGIAITSENVSIFFRSIKNLLDVEGRLQNHQEKMLQAILEFCRDFDFDIPSEFFDDQNAPKVRGLSEEELKNVQEAIFNGVISLLSRDVSFFQSIARAAYKNVRDWDKVQELANDQIQSFFTGDFNKDMVSRCLKFGHLDVKKIRAVRQWISDQTEDDLKAWLTRISGAPAVPIGGISFIESTDGNLSMAPFSCVISVPNGVGSATLLKWLNSPSLS